MNEVCASAATLAAAGRSVAWAAADIASGKIALVPTPISTKPANASAGCGAISTVTAPTPNRACSTLATRCGPCCSTKGSATSRARPWASAPAATAEPAVNGAAPKTSRM